MKIKELLKGSNVMRNIYYNTNVFFNSILTCISPTLNSKVVYKKRCKQALNLENPVTFNEKIMWLKLNSYAHNPLVIQCADKYLVRQYVEKCGCSNILNTLLGVWDSPDQINWDELPDKFVLKWNFGSGYNLVCSDKSTFDIKQAVKTLKKWGKKQYHLQCSELHYKYAPKKIVCEKYLETKQGFFPRDYRIYCGNGEPKLLYVSQHIPGKSDMVRVFTDLDWNVLDIGDSMKYKDFIQNKPVCFNEMLECCRKLSRDFQFVRVDLYDYNNTVIFGEMTFTPGACVAEVNNSPLLYDVFELHKENAPQ